MPENEDRWSKSGQISVRVVAGKTAEDSYGVDLHGDKAAVEKLADLIERWADHGHLPKANTDFTHMNIITRLPNGEFRCREIYFDDTER